MSNLAFRSALAAIVVVVGFGAVLDVMEVDAAQYAAMSVDMLHQDNWLKLYHRGEDYLDKPPLLFWLSALSFKLFGIHNWSYKLPSILYAFLGLFSTYRFVLRFHGEQVARRAVLILGSSAAFLLMNNDVRCDTILTASVITAIWAGAVWLEDRRWWQLILLSAAIASGMLVKGPMGVMAPVLALSGHVLFTRRWNVIRDMRWLLVPFLVALALVPMCIGLYEQYGMHGLRFYFWEQSFGRITGENRWKDDSTALFFTHEVIWQLLPWTLFVLVGIWDTLRSMLRGERLPEYVSISGIVLVFIALSLSHFKLPHYLYVIVPLFSVLAARAWPSEPARWQRYVQMGLVTLLALAAFWLAWFAFPSNGRWWVLALVLVPAFIAVYQRVQKNGVTLFQVSFFLMMGVGLVMNASIYPSILSYQANARVGKWAAERGLGPERFSCISEGGTSLNFYAGYTVAYIQQASEQPLPVRPGQVIYTNALGLDALTGRGARPVRTTEILNYPVQLLSLEFLDPARRAGVVERKFLLEF